MRETEVVPRVVMSPVEKKVFPPRVKDSVMLRFHQSFDRSISLISPMSVRRLSLSIPLPR